MIKNKADDNSDIGFARLCFVRHKGGIYAICCLVPTRGTHKSSKIVCGLRTPHVECSKLGKTQIIEDVRRGMARNTGFCDQNTGGGYILELNILLPLHIKHMPFYASEIRQLFFL